MHVHVVQAESSKLQQELQDLQSSTAKAEKQLQNEVSSLQGQLCVLRSSLHHFFLRPYGVLTPQRLLNQLSQLLCLLCSS